MSDVESSPIEGFWGVIPAGGSGTRLWPLSRANSPKFLHDLTGSGRSLLQGTVDRLQPLCGSNLLIVTGASHAEAVREQLPELGPNDLLVEPSPRESMPAIGLAAAILEKRDPDAVLGSFAADQVVGDTSVFEDTVRQAVEVAREGYLVTVAIRPTYPSTGFGYIRTGRSLRLSDAPDAHDVAAFVEKPDWKAVFAEWRLHVLLSCLGLIGYALFTYLALAHTSSVSASLLNSVGMPNHAARAFG